MKITAELLKNGGCITAESSEDLLELFYSEHLDKFICEFNCKFMASSKTIASPKKKFLELCIKYNLHICNLESYEVL